MTVLLPAALLVACGVGVLWLRFHAAPPALGEQIAGDLVNYFYPLNRLAAERLAAGELPLWNPDACAGIPLLATLQVAVFHPGTWLSVLLPSAQAMPLVLCIECVLGGVCAALLFARWGAGIAASAGGGLLFVFSCLLGQTFWPPQVHTIAWMPWLLLCSEALAARWRWRWWIGLALGACLQVLAGFPQYVAYTFYLLGPYALLRLWQCSGAEERTLRRLAVRAAGIALAAALGVGLAGVQLLPTVEAAAQSGRGTALAPEEIHYLTGLDAPIAPFFANALDPSPKLRAFDFRDGSGYLGIATLLLLVLGALCGRPRGLVRLLLAVGAVALLLSTGYRGPAAAAYDLYALLPGGSTFRTPERFRVLVFFCAIGVAVLGWVQVERAYAGLTRGRVVAALAAAALAALGAGAVGGASAGWRAAAALTLLLAALAWGERRGVAAGCGFGLLALLAFDLAAATGPYGSLRAFPRAWSEVFHARGATLLDAPAVEGLRARAAPGRVALRDAWPLTAPPPIRVERLACYEPLAPSPWPELHARLGGDPVWGQLLFDVDPERFPAVYDAASVTRVVTPTNAERLGVVLLPARWHGRLGPPVPARVPRVRAEERENPDALPRAYVTARFAVASVEAALEHLARGDFDFARGVLLERDPGLDGGDAPETRVTPAEIRSRTPERVEIGARSDRDALLVLTDTFYPGWTATVDGEAAEILRANGLFRAVRIGAGEHEVVFAYRPASLRRGAALSLACAAALALVPLLTRRR